MGSACALMNHTSGVQYPLATIDQLVETHPFTVFMQLVSAFHLSFQPYFHHLLLQTFPSGMIFRFLTDYQFKTIVCLCSNQPNMSSHSHVPAVSLTHNSASPNNLHISSDFTCVFIDWFQFPPPIKFRQSSLFESVKLSYQLIKIVAQCQNTYLQNVNKR